MDSISEGGHGLRYREPHKEKERGKPWSPSKLNEINGKARGKRKKDLGAQRALNGWFEGKWSVGCYQHQSESCSAKMVLGWIGEDWGRGEAIRAQETRGGSD